MNKMDRKNISRVKINMLNNYVYEVVCWIKYLIILFGEFDVYKYPRNITKELK